MKKGLALILVSLVTLCFAACGKTPSSDTEEETGLSLMGNGIGNPWIEVSENDVYDYLGYRFGIPDGAEDVIYRWNENNGLAEMQFTDSFGAEITARVKKTDSLEDISGLYYDFGDNSDNYGHGPDIYIRNNGQELRGDYYLLSNDEGCINLGIWFYAGKTGSYSFSIGAVTDSFIDMHQDEVFILP